MVSKRFIQDKEIKKALQVKFDWNTPRLSFRGMTGSSFVEDGVIMYEVSLDDIPDETLALRATCMKYVGPVMGNTSPDMTPSVTGVVHTEEVSPISGPVEDLLQDADEEESNYQINQYSC